MTYFVSNSQLQYQFWKPQTQSIKSLKDKLRSPKHRQNHVWNWGPDLFNRACRYNKIMFCFRQRQPTRPHQEFKFCLKLSLAVVTVAAVFCGQWGLQRLPSAVMARLTIMTWRSSGDDMLTWPWHNVTMTRVSLCEAVMSGNRGSLQL